MLLLKKLTETSLRLICRRQLTTSLQTQILLENQIRTEILFMLSGITITLGGWVVSKYKQMR